MMIPLIGRYLVGTVSIHANNLCGTTAPLRINNYVPQKIESSPALYIHAELDLVVDAYGRYVSVCKKRINKTVDFCVVLLTPAAGPTSHPCMPNHVGNVYLPDPYIRI